MALVDNFVCCIFVLCFFVIFGVLTTQQVDIFPDPTSVPSQAPTPFSCDNRRRCRVSNDPHFYTWDDLKYDFHGQGYYDYVAPCNKDDFSAATGLPFQVTVRQERCSPTKVTPTCVREVFITVADGTVISIPNSNGIRMFLLCSFCYVCCYVCCLAIFIVLFCFVYFCFRFCVFLLCVQLLILKTPTI